MPSSEHLLTRRSALWSGIGLAVLARAGRVGVAGANGRNLDRRAADIVAKMTLDEQIQLVNGGVGFANKLVGAPKPEGALNTSGFVRGIPRLNIPSLHETDGGQGVANRGHKRPGDEATQLPSGLALAATFDLELVRQSGAVLGAEARAKGFNVVLGGIAQIVREPRGGRNFESGGEDSLLCGRVTGAMVDGTQRQRVVSTVKHFAVNVQETGRSVHNAVIDPSALRESDLLSFQIAIEEGRPGSVMTAYNKINGEWSSESSLINQVIKGEWNYRGWVMTDWGATHSAVKAANAGLDQQSGREFDEKPWFGDPLKAAILSGAVPRGRLADMNIRIVRALLAADCIDHPPLPGGGIDWDAHAEVAQRAAEQGITLLKNERSVLPLPSGARIVLIGGHADKGVATGGGSAQVIPKGGVAFDDLRGDDMVSRATELLYAPSVPLAALRAAMPAAHISYMDGADRTAAAAAARRADIAIVFAVKSSAESVDNPSLDLPDQQNDLIDAVARANGQTIVVLETGNAVIMPWVDLVPSIVAAWYPGQRGAEALAAILSGRISPSGRSPISWPRSVDDLPRPRLPGWRPDVGVDLAVGKRPDPFDIDYFEGADVGYRWHQRSGRPPLFPFGRGLTYGKFEYSDLKAAIDRSGQLVIVFYLHNVGQRAATEVPQAYVAGKGRTHRLVAWDRVSLQPGEKRMVRLRADRRVMAAYGAAGWRAFDGLLDIVVGAEAGQAALCSRVSARGLRLRSRAGAGQL